jgi:hypothetical protein
LRKAVRVAAVAPGADLGGWYGAPPVFSDDARSLARSRVRMKPQIEMQLHEDALIVDVRFDRKLLRKEVTCRSDGAGWRWITWIRWMN